MYKRTIFECHIALSMKKRYNGLGYPQVVQRTHTAIEVLRFLDECNKTRLNKLENGIMEEIPIFASIRRISRGTGFHTTTVTKAVERLKKHGFIFEVFGKQRRRLFCIISSEAARTFVRQHKRRNGKERRYWHGVGFYDLNPNPKQLLRHILELITTENKARKAGLNTGELIDKKADEIFQKLDKDPIEAKIRKKKMLRQVTVVNK